MKPKRAKWRHLQGAPEYVLKIYDNGGETADRYSVLLGGSCFDEGLWKAHRRVHFLGLSENPNHPQGFSQFGECPPGGWGDKLIAWADLPEKVRFHVVARVCGDGFLCEATIHNPAENLHKEVVVSQAVPSKGEVEKFIKEHKGLYHISIYKYDTGELYKEVGIESDIS